MVKLRDILNLQTANDLSFHCAKRVKISLRLCYYFGKYMPMSNNSFRTFIQNLRTCVIVQNSESSNATFFPREINSDNRTCLNQFSGPNLQLYTK